MSIFKDEKSDAQKTEEKKSDLFTVVEEQEQEDDVDMELVNKVLEDDSVVAAEPEETVAEETKKVEPTEAAKETKKVEPTEAAKETEIASVEEPEQESYLADETPDTDSVTVITKRTTINGDIYAGCALDVCGEINGKVECLGKLTISGKVTGNATAPEVYVNASRLKGDITSGGPVKIGNNTVVVGNITAGSAVIAGAVKGELDVHGPVILDSTAVVKGDIKAKSVQINNGALLEGFCSLAYADVEIESMFE